MTSFETAIVVTGPKMDATKQQRCFVLGLYRYMAKCLQT